MRNRRTNKALNDRALDHFCFFEAFWVVKRCKHVRQIKSGLEQIGNGTAVRK